LDRVSLELNEQEKSVSATFLGMGKKTAVFKPGLGCMLLKGADNHKVQSIVNLPKSPNKYTQLETLPYTNNGAPFTPIGLKDSGLKNIVATAFDEQGSFEKKTRALLVVHKDSLIFEHYAKGISNDTPLIGWSMTKSITNALIGILIGDGLLNLNDQFKEENWRDSVSLHQLLQMNSGIEWAEVYDQVTDATVMLYDSEWSASPMIENSTAFDPGTHWVYSSGTTNYLSKIIRATLSNDTIYQHLPYDRLSKKLGANSFIMEMDESGHFIMSSYGYATARDWAKFGLLYLHDGVWNGKRILPEGWVEYSTQVNAVSEDGCYGAHLWLNTDQKKFKSAPADAYYFSGFQGQKVIMIPSLDLVVVRLGLTDDPDFDMDGVLESILKVVPLFKRD